MRAAVLRKLGEPLDLRSDIEVPLPRHGQVLVRVAFSGLCHSQLMEWLGKRGVDPYLPHLLGHEGAGVVIAVGPGVTKCSPGDHVVLSWIKGHGVNATPPQYRCGDELINAGSVTTFNEYVVASENRCVRVSRDIPLDRAAILGCAVLTGAGMVRNTIRPKEASTVAVYGLGGIGLSAVLALSLYRCRSIVAVDVSRATLELARQLGATHLIDATTTDPVQRILEITRGQGVDYAIEAAGMAETIEKSFMSVRRGGGRCVFASHPEHGSEIRIDPFELICGKQIQGTWGGESDPDRDIPEYVRLYLDGRFPLGSLITATYPLDNINDALEDLRRGITGRALIAMVPSVA